MAIEIVIDANVFAHAGNPGSDYFESARELVEQLLDDGRVLALDDTGGSAPVTDTSRMFMEYMECLQPGSLSHSVVLALSTYGRMNFHARPSRQTWTVCKNLVPRNQGDCIVLGVGVMSPSHTIISNDYADFPAKVRTSARKQLGVEIFDSSE